MIKYLLIICLILPIGVPVGSTVIFSWTPPTTNTDGSPLTDLRQYRMYEKIDSGPWVGRMGIVAKVNKITYRPVSTGVHRFRLTAINTSKKESIPSNEVEVTIERPIPAPSGSPTPSVTP